MLLLRLTRKKRMEFFSQAPIFLLNLVLVLVDCGTLIQGRRGNKKGKKELWKRGKIAKKGKENGIVCAGEMKSQGRHFWKIKVLSKIRSLGNYNILLRSSQNLVEHNIFSQDSSSQFSFGFSLLRKFHLDICVHSLAICPANARLLLLGKHIT